MAWRRLDHGYHVQINTHDMVLEQRSDIVCGDTMIYTIGKKY